MDDRYDFDGRHYRFVRDSRLTPAHFHRERRVDPDVVVLLIVIVCGVLGIVAVNL